jgi:hypothetical protein
MADPRNLAGILKHGLLSTTALLDYLGVGSDERARYERERRPEDVVLVGRSGEVVVLRDQRPLSMTLLARVLTEGTPGDFLNHVNRRVFFWPTVERLITMNGARAYRDRTQLVFVVDTSSLLKAHSHNILLSRINSGSTTRFAVKRSIGIFQRPADYDWSSGKRNIAEITVEDGVPDIWEHVRKLQTWRNGGSLTTLRRPYDDTLLQRLRA